MSPVNLSHIDACTQDAKLAWGTAVAGPADPADWGDMIAAVQAAQRHLPLVYRRQFAEPFLDTLGALGAEDLKALRERSCCADVLRPLYDIAQAILQRQDPIWMGPTCAFQEVVSDLYDGFLSAEDRRGVKPPDRAVIAPLVKWGSGRDPNPRANEPYTFTARATAAFGVRTAVVNLPAAHAHQGLAYWAMLGHETCGHDILHADIGLLGELREHVRTAILASSPGPADDGPWWAEYWSRRIEETASDVLGILHLGPAAVVGFIAGFRGLRAWRGCPPQLGTSDEAGSIYPCDVLRGYIGAETVRVLGFSERDAWAGALALLVDNDGEPTLTLDGRAIPRDLARGMARTVARTLAHTRLRALEDHTLIDIQNWRDMDQEIVAKVMAIFDDPSVLQGMEPTQRMRLLGGTYAAHVVAAAVTAAAAGLGDIHRIQALMLELLIEMHRNNPAWCPLQVAYPGDMSMRLAFPSLGLQGTIGARAAEAVKPAAKRSPRGAGAKKARAGAQASREGPGR
jgi:hypothetical protein